LIIQYTEVTDKLNENAQNAGPALGEPNKISQQSCFIQEDRYRVGIKVHDTLAVRLLKTSGKAIWPVCLRVQTI